MNKPFTPPFRTAPHNIEAEQALLGAILVNNEAFYRVSDFLEPKHFFEPIHQRIFESATGLVRAGKLATPVTLKTFLPADFDIAGLSVNQYLARLAAEATTIINAEDYGRTVYDLIDPPRPDRHRRGHGQPRLRRAGRRDAAGPYRGRRAQALRACQRPAATNRGFQRFAQALTTAVDMAARALSARRQPFRSGHRTSSISTKMGGLASLRSDHRRRPPRHGQDVIRHQYRLPRGQGLFQAPCRARTAARWPRMARSSASSRSKCGRKRLATRIISEQTGIPSNKIRRGAIDEADFERIKDVSIELQNLPFYIDETGGLSIGQLAARARRLKRQRGLDLLVDRLRAAPARLAATAPAKTACRKSPRSRPGSRRWPRSSTFRCWRSRNCRARSSSATTNGLIYPTCGIAAP